MKILTIAIPTWNRPASLRETVSGLLRQLTNKCRLVIVDNFSTTPAEDVLKDLLAQYPETDFFIHRNRFNIGGACNQMRCFELCDTELLWILGDDDIPCPQAINNIFKEIDKHPESFKLILTLIGGFIRSTNKCFGFFNNIN